MTKTASTSYRPDIDGMRGLAVLAVLGFHAFPAKMKGGFVGVDTFFVISGFLISGIILDSLRTNNFSFTEFYGRRIRRIFPALLIVLTTLFVVGWFILLPSELKRLSKHIACGAGFVSNFTLLKESGYFDNSSLTKPLLHLWSLGIEEQFYIFWPLFLVWAWRSRFNVLFLVILAGLISFGLNVAKVQGQPVWTFYSPITRFWELSLGAALACKARFAPNILTDLEDKADALLGPFVYKLPPTSAGTTLRHAASIVGLALILLAIFELRNDIEFPGWRALFPTLGTYLLILGGPDGLMNRHVFSRRALVWVGLISYPLYLWHWPLISLANIVEPTGLATLTKLTLLAAGFVLAWATYRFVEIPIRMSAQGTRKSRAITPALAFLMTLICVAGFLKFKGHLPLSRIEHDSRFANVGFTSDDGELKAEYKSLWREECNFSFIESHSMELDPTCVTPTSSRSIFLWGDSHAQSLSSGLREYFKAKGVSVLQIASSACKPALNAGADDYCARSNRAALTAIEASQPDLVLLAQRGDYDPASLSRITTTLDRMRIKSLIIGPLPQWESDMYGIVARRYANSVTTPLRITYGLSKKIMAADDLLKSRPKKFSSASYLSLIDRLCTAEGCLVRAGDSLPDDFMTFDYGHLTEHGSRYVAETILGPRIESILSLPTKRVP